MTQIWLKITQGQQIYIGGGCDFKQEIWKSGGVLNSTNLLYNWFDQRKSIEKKLLDQRNQKVS